MRRRGNWVRLSRKSWGFKLVCYSLVFLMITLFIIEPFTQAIAKEGIFYQNVNQIIATKQDSIIAGYLQKLIIENNVHKHHSSETFNQSEAKPLNQSQVKKPSKSKPKKATEAETQVLIAEVVVNSKKGYLEDSLIDEAYRVIRTKPGLLTTRSQLQEDINAIFATGYFSNVQVIPKDTPLGVQVTFEVIPNPILRQIELKGNIIKTLQFKDKKISLQQAIDNVFSKDYGQRLNLKKLQEGIKNLTQIYQDNGYVLANFIGSPTVQENGTVTLDIAEGIIERIQVNFLKKDSEEENAKTFPTKGITPVPQILNQFTLKPGNVFNKPQVLESLKRIFDSNLSEDLNISLNAGKYPRKVEVVINIINEYTELQRAAKLAFDAEEQENIFDAIHQFETVLKLTQLSKSKLEEAGTLVNLANLYKEQKDQLSIQKGEDAYSQALIIFKKYNVRLLELLTLINLAEANRKLNEPEQALDYYRQALHLHRSMKEKPNNNYLFGDFTDNNPLFRAKDIANIKEIFTFSYEFLRLGIILDTSTTYAAVGDYQQADYLLSDEFPELMKSLSNFKNRLEINFTEDGQKKFFDKYSKEINQTILELPKIMIRLPYNFIYSDLGDTAKAKINSEETVKKFINLLHIWKESFNNKEPDKATPYIKSIISIIEWFFNNQKDNKQLESQVQQIIALVKTFINEKYLKSLTPYIQPLTPLVITWLSQSTDDEKLAITLNQLVNLFDSLDIKNIEKWGWVKDVIIYLKGSPYYRLGKYNEALICYLQTLKALDSLNIDSNKDESNIISILRLLIPDFKTKMLLAIGKSYDALNEPKNSLTFYRQAIEIPTKFPKNELLKAEAYYGIAKNSWLLNNFSEAQSQIEMAVKESEKPSITITNLAAGSAFTSVDYKYKYGIKQRGSLAIGLGASSKTLNFTTNVDKLEPENSCSTLSNYFICRQKYFDFYINLLMQRYQKTTSKEYKIQAFQASERARTLTNQAFQSSRDIRVNQKSNSHSGEKDSNSHKRTVGRIRPAKLSEIQNQLLDQKTLLLEYFLGEEKSFLWVVSKKSIETYSLPKRSTIEAKTKQFYELLTTPTGRVQPRTTAKVGKELSEMILGPVAAQLGHKRLLIVGDGALQYIPFAVLPELKPTNNASYRSPDGEFATYMQPLLVNHEVINLLSASAMIELRQNHSKRPTPRMEMAVFADPVLDREDERIKKTSSSKNTTAASDNTISDLEGIYPSLPGTKQEAEQILKFVPPNKQTQFLGFDASYQAALDSKLNQYRIIHFATHGFFNIKSPERSGIVLSAIGKTGELQRGSIIPSSTFNMDMSAADLVVLSGCRTGLKREIIREGLTGLTGGLMSAGAERLVVSLWSVNDEATAKLMTLFYQNMFEKKLSPTQSLRSAQLSLWQDSRWQTPYNWAAFTAYGEWR
ncbi:CHAT domain-containing protein [Calothrix sp. 336/3]|uniref:CHAT domain-containing protein n=1 Tax=Calothrix sp. 336/3 TaxID=1337936 RepID=UPI00069B94EF|nr:CHAT domain-containing protein [Calothrix sp. 336/3]